MKPSAAWEGKMLKIEGLIQREPTDGGPVSQKTEIYLGYTDKNLYVMCVCFDSERGKIRAHMTHREAINSDDEFGFVLDTFHDKKYGLFFYMNPLGVQQDGIWDESKQPDFSYDMLWYSEAKLTPEGYVAWFEIPFRSLRFSPRSDQKWGVFFERDIPRNNEYAFYPRINRNVQGFLSQETDMEGIADISPGRNLQFIPYAAVRSFRNLDDRDPNHPFFTGKHIEPRIGLDSKIVLKDSLVLDATINPDFAQVESDEPQITVNQRFEVFFPEKRPFFLENAGYFGTPVNLLFTRRIVDPEYGVRLTGKIGRWALGALFADDRFPGRSVPRYDSLAGAKAYFGVGRVSYSFGKESFIGAMYTDREMRTVPVTLCTANPCIIGTNRVGGIDAKLKLSSQWLLYGQALSSFTRFNDGTHKGGPSYEVNAEYSSSRLRYEGYYGDTAEDFQTETGFFRRPDIREYRQFLLYLWRREGERLQRHGPGLFTINSWDHRNTRLEWFTNLNYRWILQNQVFFGVFANAGHERLRPKDFSTLAFDRDYTHHHQGFFFDFGYFKSLYLGGELGWGTDTNFNPASGPPVLTRSNYAQVFATIHPFTGMTIENSYLLDRLRDEMTGGSVFNNHILRSKWNYQFNRELSLRFISQYSTVLVNPARTSLPRTKNFNVDFLFTYLLHPGTALYVGYNSNLQNRDPTLGHDSAGNLLHTPGRYINDGRQLFVKVSYLFRF